MSTFNPDRAMMVDEGDDAADMLAWEKRVEKSAESLKMRIIADAFRELAALAKEERPILINGAVKALGEEIGPLLEKSAADITTAQESAQAKLAAKADALSTTLGRVEKMVRGNADRQMPVAPDHSQALTELRSCLDGLRSDLAARPMEPTADHTGILQQILSSLSDIQRTAAEPKKPTKWRHEIVDRDDYAKTKTVISTPVAD